MTPALSTIACARARSASAAARRASQISGTQAILGVYVAKYEKKKKFKAYYVHLHGNAKTVNRKFKPASALLHMRSMSRLNGVT